jgi:tetratricopeptide (TPR) repeat protein
MVDVRDPVVSAAPVSRHRSRVAQMSPEARTNFCVAALAAAVALPALILGGALPLVALVGAGLTLFAFLLSKREERPAALAWVFMALAAYTLFQILPLPMVLLRVLSPSAARIWERGAPSELIRWASLSLDPGASALEAIKWCSYGLMLVVAAWLARRKGQIPALTMVFGTALAVTLVWALHAELELDALYGLYKPRFISHQSLAPFLNRNSLAGYLTLGFFSGIGLAYQDSLRALRPLIATGAVTLLVAVLMARSTGGTAAFFVGFVVLVGLGMSRWRRSPGRLATLVAVGAVGVGVTALVVPPESWLELGKYSQKLLLVRWSLPLVRDFFLFGTGRGAFETVFPAYRQGTLEGMPNQVVYTHPENLPVQWAAEWGVPMTVATIGAISWLLARGMKKRSISIGGSCIVAGIGALILQNMVDLGLELSGVGVAVALLLGTLVASPGRMPNPEVPRLGSGRAFLGVGFAILACAGGLLGWYGFRLAWQERDAAYDALLDLKGEPAEKQGFFEGLRVQTRRRPAEPYFALVAAQGSQKLNLNAMPWIGRAIERDPSRGETYLVLALELARRGQPLQALNAVRIAIEQDETQLKRAVRLAHAISSDADQLVHGAPKGPKGTTFLLSLAASSGYELATAIVAKAAERDGRNPGVLTAQGRLVYDALTSRKQECADANEQSCLQRLEDLSNRLRAADPSDFAWLELSADLLSYQGKGAEAVGALRRGCPTLSDPVPCLHAAVTLASDSNDPALVDGAISDFLQVACVNTATCARGEADAGRAMMRVGASYKAFEHYQRSAEILPSVGVWQKAAQAARAAGLEARAKSAERRAARLASGAANVPTGP